MLGLSNREHFRKTRRFGTAKYKITRSASEVVRDALRAMGERKSKLKALRAHLSEGATQAQNGNFMDDFSMDSLTEDLDAES